MPENKADTLVVYTRKQDADISVPLYPHERYKEIVGCKNERVRLEKYLVWKLLEKVVTDDLKLDFANIKFTKTPNGKWVCPDFYFSLSHTDGLVCVAVSKSEVGVDAELSQKINEGLKERILTDTELSYMKELPSSEQNQFLLESWVKKESIFKKCGGKMLMPNTIEASEHRTELAYIELGGCEYVISVATDYDKIEFKRMEEI